jgi:hypothetical protein
VTLTSRWIFFAGSRVTESTAIYLKLDLANVTGMSRTRGVVMFSRPKIVLNLSTSHTKLSFRHGGIETFHQHLQVMLEKKHWKTVVAPLPCHVEVGRPVPEALRTTSLEADPAASPFGHDTGVSVTERAGIRGIVDRREAKEEAAQAELRSATSDFEELVRNAARVKAMIASLRASATNDKAALDEMEARLGVAAPVMRDSTSDWIGDLAAELRSWLLKHPALKSRPAIALTEVFALFNRARGSSNCVSMRDFRDSCERLCGPTVLMNASPTTGNTVPFWSLHRREDGQTMLLQGHVRRGALAVVGALLERKVNLQPNQRIDPAQTFGASIRPVDLARQLRLPLSEAVYLLDEFADDGTLCKAATSSGSSSMHYQYHWNPFLSAVRPRLVAPC